jgi:acyl phosphate:glycerol-3-phosphate acyltransferase
VDLILLIAVGYLLGSTAWGYWLPLWTKRIDIRKHGSGNMGAANVARVAGKRLGFTVALLDIAKGAAAAAIGLTVAGSVGAVVAGAAAMFGHYRPIFLRFAVGGKSVATGMGVTIVVAPIAALAAAVVWIALLLATRYSSVASLSGCIVIPVVAYLTGASLATMIFLIAGACVVVFLHRKNIGRLLHGTENQFTFSRRPRFRRAPEASGE